MFGGTSSSRGVNTEAMSRTGQDKVDALLEDNLQRRRGFRNRGTDILCRLWLHGPQKRDP